MEVLKFFKKDIIYWYDSLKKNFYFGYGFVYVKNKEMKLCKVDVIKILKIVMYG